MLRPSSARFSIILICGPVLFLRVFGADIKDSREVGEESEEVAQWWGEWSTWSTCSRTCGGGVRSQERHCLQQRLIATQNVSTSICVGAAKQYQLCPNQPCPSTRVSFKQHQCSSFNAKAFGRKHYVWVPLYPDDYISISSKPCDLQCTTTTGERQLLVPAHDGTFCRDGIFQGVCIEGQCQVVGCDGKLYSSKTVDKCGVCGGTGGSCYHVSGSYRKGIAQLGYLLITTIPAGATDVQIIERRKTENILALSDEAGHFFFNGNAIIDNPRNFHVAGTIFKYRRPANLFSEGFEYIIAQGPTNQGLNVMYYNLNGKIPHITYEYTAPRSPEPRTALPEGGSASNDTSSELPDNGNEIDVSEEHEFGNHTTPLAPYESPTGRLDPEGLVWELRTARNLTGVPGLGEESQNNEENRLQDHQGPANFAPGSNVIYKSSAHQNTTHHPPRPLLRSRFFGVPSKPGDLEAQQNSSASLDNNLSLEVYPQKGPGDDSLYSLPDLEPLPNTTSSQRVRQLKLHRAEPIQAPNTESNEFEVGSVDHDISLADMYRWKVSAYAPCSSTCTTGISTSYAMCVRYDGLEVDESHCDSLTRPEPTHEFCTGKECPPRWETSRWSECSRTCGEGYQFRTVRCWKMLAPGFDSSVYDQLCQAVQLQKPMARKACRSQSCGPQWEISDWSECSARCGGRGVQSREVRCSMETRMCDNSTRPLSEKECEGPPCDHRWTVSDWGPCSGLCGEGRMTRHVVCKNAEGNIISDAQCHTELKPLAVYPCGDRNCPAHWVEQEWEQCNATCGRGVKTRQVICSGLENGIFKEFPRQTCDSGLRPEETAACFERPCTKWFTTSWSQCSKTCGSGVKVREVKCYQGEELGHSCVSGLKPEARMSCEEQACPTEAPADEVCQDKVTANCALVLKVKLCTHWYYRKACCESCGIKAQP